MTQATFTNSKGRVFVAFETVPHTRIDGKKTMLQRWRGTCAHPGCAAVFVVVTPLTVGSTKAFERKHCDAHKLNWQQIQALGRAHQASRGANRSRVLSDAEVAEIRRLAGEGLKPADLALVYPATAGTLREIIAGRRR